MQKIVRYGILGGTFDPPHLGHLALAQEAYTQLELDRVWFVPTGDSPHKLNQDISAAAARLAMTHLAVDADERFAVIDIELRLPKPSYTLATLAALRAEWDHAELTLILGWDMLLYLPKWRDPADVIAAVDHVAAGRRPGHRTDDPMLHDIEAAVYGLHTKLIVLGGPQLDLSASDIRARTATGLPIRYLVPDAVRAYIQEHHLYRPQLSLQP